ncbi:MAG TPA: transglutaminaseTgpA domain-containing protein [Candidatus Acidoferrales bacterium]|nr:transglutaminaseTgpA domain-containing protein [Candidatus Acidoferrales bacterium]
MATAVRAPRASLSALVRYSEVSLFLLLVSGVASLLWTGKLDPVSATLAPLALAIKAWRYARGKPPELSHRQVTWAVSLYILFFPFDMLVFSRAFASGTPNTWLYAALHAAIHLMLFVMILRLYSARTSRDLLFLSMMALAALLASAILTIDTAFLVFLALFLILGVSTFMSLEMRRAAEGAVAPPLEARTPASRRLGRALGVTAVLMTIGTLSAGAVIFVGLPRFPIGYLGGLNFNPTLISGFSDNVELGRIGEIKLNSAVVMRTRLDVPRDAVPNLRWRGIALTNFDGHRWFTPEHRNTTITMSNDGWYHLSTSHAPQVAGKFRAVSYSVLIEPMAANSLFVLAHPLEVRGPFGHDASGSPREGPSHYLWVDQTNSIFTPYGNSFSRYLYEGKALVPVLPPDELRKASTDYPASIRDAYLQLPPLDPAIPALARDITRRAKTPFDKSSAIELYLRTRFGYTLTQPDPPPKDPLAYFLFTRRAGHCEYFATAMTVMVRSLGIPARYINGFLLGEYNDVADSYIVRGSDAHSWVEVYFPDYGWIPFDPTPPVGSKPEFSLGRLAYYWDWFEMAWSEWVINYSQAQQMHLATNATRTAREWSYWMQRFLYLKQDAGVQWVKGWHKLLEGGFKQNPKVMLLPALLLAAIVLLLVRGRALADLWISVTARAGSKSGHSPGRAPRLATLYYSRLLRALERRGFRKPDSQTPREFALSLSPAPLAERVAEMTRLYEASRFGREPADAAAFARSLRAIEACLP